MSEEMFTANDAHDARGDYDLLRQWGVIHRKTVTWRPRPDLVCTVTSGRYRTGEEAVADAWQYATDVGYEPPRWFEWWRWREERPPNPKAI